MPFPLRRFAGCFVLLLVAVAVSLPTIGRATAQDLSHRKSNLTLSIEDAIGNPITGATVDIRMTQHAFRLGSQVRDRFYSITRPEFDSLSEAQKQSLLPGLSGSGQARYTPTWQDAANYRSAISENFNHVVPTIGMQWLTYNAKGTFQ